MFYFGVDLSYVNEMEDCGAIYKVKGEPQDPFNLFHDFGSTLVRARLWHTPTWTNYSNLSDVKKTFRRAKNAGMSTMLDIHYSDTWADPGRQTIPEAWATLETTNDLANAVYSYTQEVMSELYKEGLPPDFVQIGNETNSGMLKEIIKSDWPRDVQLFNAGIRAVRDFSTTHKLSIQILLHVAQPENTTWWFTEAEKAGIEGFDIIGISYYPQWSSFSITDLAEQVGFLRERFKKEVMIVETAYPWTLDYVEETASNILTEGLKDYPITSEGQRSYMHDLSQSLITSKALGVIYWEPAWVSTKCSTLWGQGSHWENATFFEFDGELHTGIAYQQDVYTFPAQ